MKFFVVLLFCLCFLGLACAQVEQPIQTGFTNLLTYPIQVDGSLSDWDQRAVSPFQSTNPVNNVVHVGGLGSQTIGCNIGSVCALPNGLIGSDSGFLPSYMVGLDNNFIMIGGSVRFGSRPANFAGSSVLAMCSFPAGMVTGTSFTLGVLYLPSATSVSFNAGGLIVSTSSVSAFTSITKTNQAAYRYHFSLPTSALSSTPLTLSGSWTQGCPATYTCFTPSYAKSGTTVYLKGVFGSGSAGTVATGLPAPSEDVEFVTITNANTAVIIKISTSGELSTLGTSTNWFSIDGLSYQVALTVSSYNTFYSRFYNGWRNDLYVSTTPSFVSVGTPAGIVAAPLNSFKFGLRGTTNRLMQIGVNTSQTCTGNVNRPFLGLRKLSLGITLGQHLLLFLHRRLHP
eukprot:TRINITY_DN7439_c0_g1_i1.p1 TRINITY_DN7439_c0_g1~~TRINITY_DN7439_c0_g1_i1.p1  ORF type:complete len:399 (-),score=71.08 TRINITY_DN7439_c0_g1_i1:33-1229(-)